MNKCAKLQRACEEACNFAAKKIRLIMKLTVKDCYAGIVILVATVLSFMATLLPPQGIVDSSMLYLIAQWLLLAATLLGAGAIYEKMLNLFKKTAKTAKDGDKA